MPPVKALLSNLLPTRAVPQLATKVISRQSATTTVVSTGNSGNDSQTLNGGSIAGIVIGSIVGILLLVWIIRSCSNLGKPGGWGGTFGEQEKPPSRRGPDTYYHQESRRSGHHHHHHSRSRSRSHYDHSPRRSSRVVDVEPVYVSRGRSQPRPPRPVYVAQDARQARRSSRGNYYV